MTSPRRTGARIVFCAASTLAQAATPGIAQEPPAVEARTEASQRSNIFAARVWTGLGEDRQGAEQRTQALGGIGTSFTRASRRATVGGALASRIRVDVARQRSIAESDGSVLLSFAITRRATATMSGRASYAPIDPLNASRSMAPPQSSASTLSVLDSPLATRHVLTSTGTADVSYTVSKRSTVGVTHSSTYYGGNHASVWHQVGTRFVRRVTPAAAFRVGYRFGSVTSRAVTRDGSPIGSLITHDMDLGLEYAGAVISPRTTVGLTTGSSFIDEGRGQTLRVLATATLSHAFTRRWQAAVGYGRPLQYLAGASMPVLSDKVDFTVTGAAGRHSGVTLVAGYSAGKSPVGDQSERFRSYSGSLAWHTRLARRTAFQAEGFYGQSIFGAGVILAPGVPHRFAYAGVRAFVTHSLFGTER